MNILQFFEYLIAAHLVRERVQNNSAADSGKIDYLIINGVAQNKGNCIAWLKSNFCKIPIAAVNEVVKFPICPPIITLNKKSLSG